MHIYERPVVLSISPRSGPFTGATDFRVTFVGFAGTAALNVSFGPAGFGADCYLESTSPQLVNVARCLTPPLPLDQQPLNDSACLLASVRVSVDTTDTSPIQFSYDSVDMVYYPNPVISRFYPVVTPAFTPGTDIRCAYLGGPRSLSCH
jgi:hypothetical protein